MPRSGSVDQQALDRLLSKQHLVLARSQAGACGVTPSALQHRLRPGGPWQKLLPGVYLTVTGTPTTAQQEIAALLYAGPDSVITGLQALRRSGMRVPESPQIPVLIPASRARVSTAFVTALPTSRMPGPVGHDGPVQFALPPRAAADAARQMSSYGDVRALIAVAVQQGFCRIDQLADELRQGPVRGSAWLRRALAEVAETEPSSQLHH